MVKVQEIKGFNVLPVLLTPTAVQKKVSDKATQHFIYIKKHSVNTKDLSLVERANRSLFAINLPINTSLPTLKAFFGKVATGAIIESFETNDDTLNPIQVDLTKLTSEIRQDDLELGANHRLPLGCSLITFIDTDALNLALSAIKKLVKSSKHIDWEFDLDFGGVAYFDSLYGKEFLSAPVLLDQVAHDMLVFNQREQDDIDELQEMKEVVDEDGFTLVIGSHRKTKNGVLGKFKAQQNHEMDKLKSRMKKKEKLDFYRFQIREKKKQEMNDLLNKFKDDQEKVRMMKEKKRFKPY